MLTRRIITYLFSLMISLPIVFITFFWGYFPVRYDIVLHTDNVVGEGICTSYGSQVDGRTTVNIVSFYFGSQLKTATIQNYFYDVDSLYLQISDVSAFDLISIDSYVKGIHMSHYDMGSIFKDVPSIEEDTYSMASVNDVLHVDVHDPDNGAIITFEMEFIPSWFWILYFSVILLLALLLACIISIILERLPSLNMLLMGAAGIAASLLAGCFLCGSLAYVKYTYFILNWILLCAVSLGLNAITLPFLGTIIVMAFTTFWYIANYFVIALRGKPIMPADLKAIGTAQEVMGGYTFMPSLKMIFTVIVVSIYAFALIILWNKYRTDREKSFRFKLFKRALSVTTAVLLIFFSINNQTFQSLNTFAWDFSLMRSFHEEGMVLAYLKSVFNSKVKKPEGYSQEIVRHYLKEYQSQTPLIQMTVQPTTIIMVMNEAFSDLRTVGLDKRIDVMPFIDSLSENTVKGNMFVSVIGGGTCNTEFEGLTGNTLAFLGAGAYPYTENVTKPLFSLASYFRSLGYCAEAFHANEADNWNRNQAYPNLGFEAFHSIEDYTTNVDVTYLHNQPADISDYQYIKSVNKAMDSKPKFLFNVTMQNHSPYDRWLDVEKAQSVEDYGSNLYLDSQVYLSLVYASDIELSQLMKYYKDNEEPTMIVFFGDHQPGLPAQAIKEIYTEVNSNLDMYKTKFFIWTNYETQEWHNAGISANYLPLLILERGNFPLPPYVQMLKELYEHFPIISSQGVMDIDGNIYDSVADVMDDPLIQKYQYIQYANLFDEIDPAWFRVKG